MVDVASTTSGATPMHDRALHDDREPEVVAMVAPDAGAREFRAGDWVEVDGRRFQLGESPDWPHFWDCLHADGSRSCFSKAILQGRGKLADPVAPPHHDGQASTSSIRREPGARREAVADLARGAALWQQADRLREVMIGIRGHVVAVTASASPAADAHSVRLESPMTAGEVAACLDAAVAAGKARPLRCRVAPALLITEDDGEPD